VPNQVVFFFPSTGSGTKADIYMKNMENEEVIKEVLLAFAEDSLDQ